FLYVCFEVCKSCLLPSATNIFGAITPIPLWVKIIDACRPMFRNSLAGGNPHKTSQNEEEYFYFPHLPFTKQAGRYQKEARLLFGHFLVKKLRFFKRSQKTIETSVIYYKIYFYFHTFAQ